MTVTHIRQANQASYSGPPAGGGGDGMEARIAKLEATVGHIDTQITDLKTDVRELRGDMKNLLGAGIGALILVLGALAMGYMTLGSKVDASVQVLGDKIEGLRH